jgi:hypothetical protein
MSAHSNSIAQELSATLDGEKVYLEQLQSELDLIHNTARRQGRKVQDGQREPLDAAIDETTANIHALERVLGLISRTPATYNQQ